MSTNTSVYSLAVSGSNLFAGTGNGGVWRRPLSEIITDVENDRNNLPTNFALEQNYPNPFNPSTTIKYDLPKEGFVTLKVYDMLGREVATLVNKEQSAGRYIITFDASGLASGIYFYRISAGKFLQTKKLILLR
ncbi:MAG TPA: T9SS type A sorting domain-containing protein [Ignavibacteria bacterium]|nr:T9SS type A sorting domain-containing protein [Ignavibacteria bacterium]